MNRRLARACRHHYQRVLAVKHGHDGLSLSRPQRLEAEFLAGNPIDRVARHIYGTVARSDPRLIHAGTQKTCRWSQPLAKKATNSTPSPYMSGDTCRAFPFPTFTSTWPITPKPIPAEIEKVIGMPAIS